MSKLTVRKHIVPVYWWSEQQHHIYSGSETAEYFTSIVVTTSHLSFRINDVEEF